MKISRANRQINYVGDTRDQECRAFFEKSSRDGIRVGLLVRIKQAKKWIYGQGEMKFRYFVCEERSKAVCESTG